MSETAPGLPELFAAGAEAPCASSVEEVRLTGLEDDGGLFAMRELEKFRN